MITAPELFDRCVESLKAAAEDVKFKTGEGVAKDYAEYRERVGRAKGYEAAIDVITREWDAIRARDL